MNILIVDSNEKCLNKIHSILLHSFELKDITTTSSTNEALKIVQKKTIDLIILDFIMEDISGFHVAKALQHTQKTKTIPIIFLIDDVNIDFSLYGFEIGSIDYILKPIDPHLLISRITLYNTIIQQNNLLYKTNKLLRKEILKNKDKIKLQEHMLVHQSKTSSMGEMIGAIAHQWRQPLNIIATSMINLETKAELEVLDLKEIKRINQKVNETLNFLSQTIDNFRNFFLISKKKEEVNLVDAIFSTIGLIQVQFKAHNIFINFTYNKIDTFNCFAYKNEIQQVIMNILLNAKDAIELKHQQKEGKINIDLKKKNYGFCINICDNGGGVDQKIIKKIFNPYFTTKFEDQGTGTGLYMSKTIIEQYHEGRLEVRNQELGACFTIILQTIIQSSEPI